MLPPQDKAPLVDSVTRLIAYAGAFQLKKAANARDLAPDRVRDLAVKNVTRSSGNLAVTLSWTSTGANLDTGRAKSLDLRSSLKSRDLVYKFKGATKITNDDVLEGDLTPKDPFSLHTVKVRLPEVLVSASQDKPGSIFLGLRTKNKRGKQSQVSNIAPVVWLAAVKTTTVKTTRPPTAPHRTSTPMTYKPDPYTPTTYTPEPYAQPDKGWSLATIMAVLLGLLFLVTVVIIGYYTLKRSSDDKRGNEERLAGYVKVRLPEELVSASQDKPGSIFLGLLTENNRGKKSQVSNIAPVVWPAALQTTTVKTTRRSTASRRTSTPMTYAPEPYTPTTYTPEPYAEPDKGLPLATIMAVLLGLLFLVAVVIIGYYTLKRSSDDTRGNGERLAGYGDTTMGDTSFHDTTSGSSKKIKTVLFWAA
ncbi:calcium-activated chloride channel regulator 1-like [Ixodes scapularis]